MTREEIQEIKKMIQFRLRRTDISLGHYEIKSALHLLDEIDEVFLPGEVDFTGPKPQKKQIKQEDSWG